MTTTDVDIRPIIDPILALLCSRKFLTALAGLAGDLVVLAIPTLQPMRDQLVGIITVFALSIIGTTAFEDVNRVHADAKVAVAEAQASALTAAPLIRSAGTSTDSHG